MRLKVALLMALWGMAATQAPAQQPQLKVLNHGLPVLDAHNCYPYRGNWTDRIDRALSTGYPVGIEQDLAWYIDPQTKRGRIAVSHSNQPEGAEPTLQQYFFDRVQTLIEGELKSGDHSRWPLIVLHFDFKDNQIPLLRAVWDLLGTYEKRGWLTTALKTADPTRLSSMDVRPILVLTEESNAQEQVFFTEVQIGSRLRLFGSARTSPVEGKTQAERNRNLVDMPPSRLFPDAPTNYRRWWNGSWYAVEEGGAPGAGDWTPGDQARLTDLVDSAHERGYWIRFYTLDGFAPADDQGWGRAYNFGSSEAARIRWAAALKSGVNLIATDQYESFASFRQQQE